MNFKSIYMVGIGGIGMSALAQFLVHDGRMVTGSDREESPTTKILNKKGIDVHIGHLRELPEGVEMVIYSDAIPEDNLEIVDAKKRNIPTFSYFATLGEVSKNKFTITVSGTHGKTTTTGMLGKLLVDSGKDPTIIVGSIMKNFGSNYHSGESDLFVVEGCEYKDHLLNLNTNILIVTNIEFDHPDYFKDLAHVQDTFKKAIRQLPESGIVITNPNDPNIIPILKGVSQKIIDYTKEDIGESKLTSFNEMNAKTAFSAAFAYDGKLSKEKLVSSLEDFKGMWRRFEFKGKTKKGAQVYDDYAHHPTEVSAALSMAKKMPFKRVIVAFHPHLISRTKVFFDEFVETLSIADQIIIAPIYRARTEIGEEVTSEMLVEELKKKGKDVKYLETFEEIQKELENTTGKGDLVITMGAGDIYKVADNLVL